jgi:inner membrane protein involved in colicin E2 resistance
MVKRIAALVFIFGCTAVGWFILGATIFQRTYQSDAHLRNQVMSIWGAPQEQKPPEAVWERVTQRPETTEQNGKRVTRTIEERVAVYLPVEASKIHTVLDLEHRQKGLLWYSTYKVAFTGAYRFTNASEREQAVTFRLAFPAAKAIYDDLTFTLDDAPLVITHGKGGASAVATVPAGRAVNLEIHYRSQGLESWRYNFGGGEVEQVKNFQLKAVTNFAAIDFPGDTLSPTEKRETPNGWELEWNYKNLVSGFQIGIAMPQKLQPGPLAGRISLFAPVSLLFFFFLMFIITTLRGIDLHPMNYFFLAAAFFAFHLLLAYLVDHISVNAAFVICSAVSIFLVVSYLRLVVGIRFAAVEAGLAQLIYLVLFSYAFFFEGYTGLTVTIGSIITLFVVMQMTGRIRWTEKFSQKPA